MAKVNFDELEEELGIVIPNIYRMFICAVNFKGLNLEKYGIYHNTKEVLKGNEKMREALSKENPGWKKHYFDFGVSDGCGNYFFLIATKENDDVVKLWAHDPPGIEDVSSGTMFFKRVISELEAGFKGPNQYCFIGTNN